MKQKLRIILTLLLLILILTSCNTENEGIFKTISQSVPKVNLGSIDIIGLETPNTLWAYTSAGGFQQYDTTTLSRTAVPKNPATSGLPPYHYTLVGSTLIYATRANEGEENSVYTFDGTTHENKTEARIRSTATQAQLMLVQDNTNENEFTVKTVNASGLDTEKATYPTQFTSTYPPLLIASSQTNFIVSGKSSVSSNYVHYLNDEKEITDGTSGISTGSQLVAMGESGTSIVAIAADGSVWHGTTSATGFSKSSTTLSLDDPKMAYPSFVHDGHLYLQDANNVLYKVKFLDGTVSKDTSELAMFLKNKRVKSYFVDSSSIFIGTMANGLFEKPLTDLL